MVLSRHSLETAFSMCFQHVIAKLLVPFIIQLFKIKEFVLQSLFFIININLFSLIKKSILGKITIYIYILLVKHMNEKIMISEHKCQ